MAEGRRLVMDQERQERHRQRVENLQLVMAHGGARTAEATSRDLADELGRCAHFDCAPGRHDGVSVTTVTPAPFGLRAVLGLFGRWRDALS